MLPSGNKYSVSSSNTIADSECTTMGSANPQAAQHWYNCAKCTLEVH